MSTDATVGAARETILNELAQARDVSETRSFAELREATGLGHEDLTSVLEAMNAGGDVREETPGEYVLMHDDDIGVERESEVDDPGVSLEEAERRAAAGPMTPRRARRGETETAPRKVSLTRGVAAALDAAALGALVKAGIDEAAEQNATFVFEVTL